MFVLAEISDKIFLPVHALAFGCFFCVLMLIFGSLLSIKSRWYLFLYSLFLGVLMIPVWGFLVDPELAEHAEREIFGFHMRMRLGLGGPVVIGAMGAWVVGGYMQKRKTLLRRSSE